MGFWGSIVVHRGRALARELLPEIPELRDAELEHDQVSGGWQVTRIRATIDDLPDTFLTGLRDATKAPVLAASVLDSSAAYLAAVGVETPFWDTWLNIDSAVGYTVLPSSPFDEDGNYLGAGWVDPEYEAEVAATRQSMLNETLHGTPAASAAVAWAREAGLDPAPIPEVEAALATTETFVEEQLFALIGLLGIDTRSGPVPPTAAEPTVAELLTTLIGHRLEGIDVVGHQPVRGEPLDFTRASDLLWRFADRPPLISCGCHDEVLVRAASVSPEQSFAYHPAVPFAGAALTGAVLLLGIYAQIEGMVLRFGERDLIVRAGEGGWITTLDDSVRLGLRLP
ncbi:hypothetical protein Aph02nite_26560 [Actinoplanes philippinensis]|uniref:Uncharacterized protein n=1 Tax=Actinoplanes philippinensis TaxID=35752 RepID=A0A1I2GAA5_9ACTN|nr:hypothetical protein [Actinoplanes philippinensis]GIE76706.1 hypothetical protein Aph02nite_26560 [Actinoplanes philippinensis]SFF13676.1 hypothetical protein SAMN05421541_106313 [Actinoplanes philippinensis]